MATNTITSEPFDLPLTDNKPVGGVKSGNPFYGRKGNNPVKSIKFWSTKSQLVAIEISWHFDESTETYGDTSKGTESKVLSLDVTEKVEYVSIWKTTEGDAISSLELQTDGVQRFGVGTQPDNVDPIREDVGNGYLIALTGSAGEELNSLSLLFLSDEVELNQRVGLIEFHNQPSASDIKTVTAFQQDFRNNTSGPMEWSFDRSKTYISTQEWKRSRTEDFGVSTSITGGFLGISAGATTEWKISDTTEHGRSWSDSETFGWRVGGVIQPGKAVRVTAYALEGTFSSSFDYRVELTGCPPGVWPPPPVCPPYWSWLVQTGYFKGGLFSQGEVVVKNL